ncbi:MAG: enoyl-CoA hydratase/isomerase family protein [Candidatus Hydrogenedentes bacterium]|nr:enoyl-CoA hydratase/isomerase family protein [Candidatus Hydrogenedentota bacterium]
MSNESTTYIRVETRESESGEIVTITIDRASKLNAMNSDLCAELIDRLDALRGRTEVRAVVLTGAGEKAFIGGADLRELATLNPERARTFITKIHSVCEGIRKVPVPVIARINGYCYGAGLEVAASCDLRVASENAIFGMPEVKVGVPSVVEAALLPRLIGWGKTQELLYTGDDMSAEEAHRCGLIQKLVPAEGLDEAVETWLSSLLEAAPLAVRLQKQLIREWESLPVDQAILRGIDSFESAYATDEPTEYLNRFLNRKR